jgi:hypothetical protein
MRERALTANEQRAASSLRKLDTGTLRLTLAQAMQSKPVLARLIHAELERRKQEASPASVPTNEMAPAVTGAGVPKAQYDPVQRNSESLPPQGIPRTSANSRGGKCPC